jgi:hypothetical protein
VLGRLQRGGDPNIKYPDGTKAITRAIENLEQARIKKIVEEYYKNLNIIDVLLDAGVILSESDETKLDKNVDKHMASYLKNKTFDTKLAKHLATFDIFWSKQPKIRDGQAIEATSLRDIGEFMGTVTRKGGRTKQNNKSKRRVKKNRSMRKKHTK